jgi:hypothetical protein
MVNKNVLLYHLVRILTPDELNELTSTSKGRNLVSLTDMLCEDLEDKTEASEGAKILPFKKNEDVVEKEVNSDFLALDIRCGEKCLTILDDYVKRITVLNKKFSKNCPVNQETSSFIISEKTRFKDNYNKIKSKEILSLYQKNASVDIDREKSSKKDEQATSSSSILGILINKKQA